MSVAIVAAAKWWQTPVGESRLLQVGTEKAEHALLVQHLRSVWHHARVPSNLVGVNAFDQEAQAFSGHVSWVCVGSFFTLESLDGRVKIQAQGSGSPDHNRDILQAINHVE